MYKRLKSHASVYFGAEELGVSDYEDEDGVPMKGMGTDLGPAVLGDAYSDADSSEEDMNRNLMCRICPHKKLVSEADVEKHLSSVGHLKAMKAYLKVVIDEEEKEALVNEIASLEALLKDKWTAKASASGGDSKTPAGKKKKKKKIQQQQGKKAKAPSADAEPKRKSGRKRKNGEAEEAKDDDDDGKDDAVKSNPKKRKRKGKNTRMRERQARLQAQDAKEAVAAKVEEKLERGKGKSKGRKSGGAAKFAGVAEEEVKSVSRKKKMKNKK
eukprot:CAMPEP_0114506888 /NCGR_PEP_ID=MMETSP0109-20121206/11693_1 /TAXON_ID=29199 /ORGANISM="Chlorarachnion reptans, Strain CCCM449" /LENGTH=269 /DNA_ID=CAMNT_0001685557 /DNA_START=58 /DNA_END=867 /DNA_ORIENTATION=-